MKILIAADMEGVSDITRWEDVDPAQGRNSWTVYELR